jgi:UMF1 family MFS transporter
VNTDRRRILAWCLYDFANSAYSAVIVATVFSIYYVSHIVGNERGWEICGGAAPSRYRCWGWC